MFLILALVFPVSVKAQDEKIILKEKIQYVNVLSSENTFYAPSEEVIEKVTKDYELAQAKLRAKKAHIGSYQGIKCSCVLGINAYYGTNFHTTNVSHTAISIPINSYVPAETGFAITYESKAGHIIHYYKLGDVIVVDAEWNYKHFVRGDCPMTSGRIISIGSSVIKGYIN